MRDGSEKIAVLLCNLGTPEAPTAKGVKAFLKAFLSDPRVIEKQNLLWKLILYLVILPFSSRKSVERYKSIWSENGSPLTCNTYALAETLQARLNQREVKGEVAIGMRYGKPAIITELDRLLEKGFSEIVVFPLFPQYASATVGSIKEVVLHHIARKLVVPEVRFVKPYYDNESYIEALSESVLEQLGEKTPQALLLSYHALPIESTSRGEPYHEMCCKTTKALSEKLGKTSFKIVHCYQSRFGRGKWLTPDIKDVVTALAAEGIKDIAVACPSFLTDCLETLLEIDHSLRTHFMGLGGESFHYIRCLNCEKRWVDSIIKISGLI